MKLTELEAAVTRLPADELAAFAEWFEAYLADEWDRRIEADINAGRLDEAGRRADASFEAGRDLAEREAARRREEMPDPGIGLSHEETWDRIAKRNA